MASVRVIIHYQTPLLASGLEGLIQKAAEVSIAGMTGDLQEALRMVGDLQPEVIVVEGGACPEEGGSCSEFLRRSPHSLIITLRLDQPAVRICRCQERQVSDESDLIGIIRGEMPLCAGISRDPPVAR